mmetsp:Transcript_61032/g.162021  ORF Transcript_61032/g.162021 Transcript_61032/m.162021 type:complete len:295 (+) Transcript_61032:744-1628(+)
MPHHLQAAVQLTQGGVDAVCHVSLWVVHRPVHENLGVVVAAGLWFVPKAEGTRATVKLHVQGNAANHWCVRSSECRHLRRLQGAIVTVETFNGPRDGRDIVEILELPVRPGVEQLVSLLGHTADLPKARWPSRTRAELRQESASSNLPGIPAPDVHQVVHKLVAHLAVHGLWITAARAVGICIAARIHVVRVRLVRVVITSWASSETRRMRASLERDVVGIGVRERRRFVHDHGVGVRSADDRCEGLIHGLQDRRVRVSRLEQVDIRKEIARQGLVHQIVPQHSWRAPKGRGNL